MLCLEQDLGYDSSIVNKMIKKKKTRQTQNI
jgi:hypothetical protein